MKLHNIIDKNGCSLPWIHAEINLHLGIIKPCCKYKSNIPIVKDLKSIWIDQDFQNLRQDIIDGKPHSNCDHCNVPKETFSYKSLKNKLYYEQSKKISIDNLDLPNIFTISLGNVCNFACRMCNPSNSSKISELSKKSKFLQEIYGVNSSVKKNIELLSGIFKNANVVTFTGGEPLIDENFIRLIEMIKKESLNIKTIAMSTNMSIINKKIIDLLASIDTRVQFNVSIDGPKKIHEYIRHGSDWNLLLQNLTYLKSRSSNFYFGINSTIGALNVGYLPELCYTLDNINNELKMDFTHVMCSPVLDSHLHPGNLPQHIKKIYIDKLNSNSIISSIKNSEIIVPTGLKLLSNKIDSNSKIINFIKEYDKVTKTDYKLVYPEFNF